jgi:hypothetical protein
VNATLQTTPPDATHWSVRTLAKRQRVSPATVHRTWQAHNLQPHRVETFKLSRDPEFVSKLRDIVGLYLNPPAKALVLSVDEKSQIQALDRTQPILPLRLSRRPCGPRNLMKIALRYDRRGRERQGRALTGAVKAVYLSDPERACWANKWASLSPLGALIACDPA